MNFKLHLTIIVCIVVAVLLAWQVMHLDIAATPETGPSKPQYSLTVIHASWGLNCPNVVTSNNIPERDAFVNKGVSDTNNKLREDNVLGVIAPMCNGNLECQIIADEANLGKDPAPDCSNKVLEVEYRCFSYDRPWKVKSSTGTLSLKCEQPTQ